MQCNRRATQSENPATSTRDVLAEPQFPHPQGGKVGLPALPGWALPGRHWVRAQPTAPPQVSPGVTHLSGPGLPPLKSSHPVPSPGRRSAGSRPVAQSPRRPRPAHSGRAAQSALCELCSAPAPANPQEPLLRPRVVSPESVIGPPRGEKRFRPMGSRRRRERRTRGGAAG